MSRIIVLLLGITVVLKLDMALSFGEGSFRI